MNLDDQQINATDVVPGVKQWTNPRNQFLVYQIHYTADPRKRNPNWIQGERSAMPINDWNREYEIDFSSFTGKPVFLNDFD